MKKILLVGNLTGSLQTVHDNLIEEYQVQLTMPIYKSVHGMLRIVKADMVIIFQSIPGEIDNEIILGLKKEWRDTPVMIICAKEEWGSFKTECVRPQFHSLFRPINKTSLLEEVEVFFNEIEHGPGESVVESDVTAAEENAATDKGENEPSNGLSDKSDDELVADILDSIAPKKPKIIAVDDNPIVLRNINQILGGDYEVYMATSGQKMLDMTKKFKASLILLDYEMPGMSGLEAYQNLKKNSDTAHIPVVFLTGVSDKQRILEVLSNHPAGYMLKPIETVQLVETVQRILSENR